MGHSMLLQDWTTSQGAASVTVIQNEADWGDIPGFQDAAFYVEVSQVTGTGAGAAALNLDIQCSPTKDETFFGAAPNAGNAYVANFNFAAAPTTGVQALVYSRWASVSTTQALARYIRWRIRFGNAAQSITFRIWVNFNQSGWM